MRDPSTREFMKSLARAGAGALLFMLPLLMTMEMWWLGFHMDPLRLALLIVAILPLLAGLAFYSGFKRDASAGDAIMDAFVAYAVGFVTAGIVLALFSIIRAGLSTTEILGMVTLQAVPGAFGAVLAFSQLGGGNGDEREEGIGDSKHPYGYFGEVFLMVGGALFFAFNVAPTEEMIVIALRMSAWHGLAIVFVSLAVMHAFVYSVSFRGQHKRPESYSTPSLFLCYTVVGYAIALLVSLYCLWTFGRTDDTALATNVKSMIVLGFPATVGAASARLIL